MSLLTGLGDESAKFRVYIGNRPTYDLSGARQQIVPLMPGELKCIGLACGNGWRKVFNVYAKLLYALPDSVLGATKNKSLLSWQAYRDQQLLQVGSNTALCFEFNPAILNSKRGVHLIMGRTYAKSLQLPTQLTWLDKEFAIAPEHNVIVCPYFDYRQLSNIKIIRLVALIEQLVKVKY
jgi:hypothetical protein